MHPSHFSIEGVIRSYLLATPKFVTTCSDELQPRSGILLNANENSLGSCFTSSAIPFTSERCCCGSDAQTSSFKVSETATLHRYPSESQSKLKHAIAEWRCLPDIANIHVGPGSATIIDLLIRMTCNPSEDAIIITPPTFGSYKARAVLNNVQVIECPLTLAGDCFTMEVEKLLFKLQDNPKTKIVFLASPGNPTGTLIPLSDIKRILEFSGFKGLVVLDEAYIDFSDSTSGLSILSAYANLLVIQTFSKNLGLAGARLGAAFGHPALIENMDKLQVPFSTPSPTSALVTLGLSPAYKEAREKLIAQTIYNRQALIRALDHTDVKALGVGKPLGENQANFILLPILKKSFDRTASEQRDNDRAKKTSEVLLSSYHISVTFVGHLHHCEACLRITVGTEVENKRLIQALICTLKK